MKKFVIVIPSYKNKDWYKKNILSVLSQNYPHFRIIYTDDNSPDGTADLVEQLVNKHNKKYLVKLIRNTVRKGAMRNLYDMIHSCENDEIILTVDGDDHLAHSTVLTKLNKIYSNPNIWMTYGQYRSHPDGRIGCGMQIPPNIINNSGYRRFRWCSSHLRTFYTWLFKKIKETDFHDPHGNFYPMAWDLAMMFPMLEMSGQRSKFINDVLYMYNVETPLNDSKVNLKLQQDLERHIRARPKYKLLLKKG